MWNRLWEHLWTEHRGKTSGAAAGVLFGLIYLLVGLWDMLIFALIVYTGYYIGRRLDRGDTPVPVEETWRWLMDKWRLLK
jgi:hypothetical protein